jgi:hypothetical protein
MANHHNIIGIESSVEIQAADADAPKGPRSFISTIYTGGPVEVNGWDLPVVIDLAGLKTSKVLVANLDHEDGKRVGNFEVANDGKTLIANGKASAATAYRDEVVNSADEGYTWQTSVEVKPHKVEQLARDKKAVVNGQTVTGPAYITRTGTLKGFAFVSHGADDNTTATIAATAASTSNKVKKMKPEIKAWAEAMGIDIVNASDDQLEVIEANYNGLNKTSKPIKASDPFQARKVEAKRRQDIRDIADRFLETRRSGVEEIEAVEKLVDHAIEAGMDNRDFRLELYDSMQLPQSQPIISHGRDTRLSNKMVEAAICQAGRLAGHEKAFDDQTLQMAHDQFRGNIGLKQLLLLAAEQNGYRASFATEVNMDVQRAAFRMHNGHQPIHATGFSTIDISTILSNVANKFVMEGWNAVDMTPMSIAPVRNVRDYKQITTVSLTGDLQYEQLGPDGQIKHGTVGNLSYNNQADIYARMLAITEKDIVNDDLGALTVTPRRLGRGAALKLNDLFWTVFLDNSAFFTSGRKNVNEGVANMTLAGLDATETIFNNQTDPDGKPLALMARILLVPTALKNTALALTDPISRIQSGLTTGQSDVNVFAGRFNVLSSPYMSNSSYTGYSAAAWYMLADPQDMPVIEIAALNGRVEPIVETADADFNVLGIQMRGKSSVGVALQEYRAGVRADGGAS